MAIHLVTGGAGFIGSSLAAALLHAGDTVRIVDDFSTGRRRNVEELRGKVELVEGTICDADTVKAAMRGVDVVFHQAAIPSVARSIESPAASMLANVQGTTVLVEGARQAGVKRLVYASSSSVYGDTPTLPKIETMPTAPLSPYAVSKLAGEQLLRVYAAVHGMETVSLRYFNVFGPRQDPASAYAAAIPSFCAAALRGEPAVVHGDGEQTRDFCFIDNVVDANLLAAATPHRLRGEALNVACGERTSLNQLLALVGELAGARVEVRPGPSRLGDVRDSVADVRAARELLGYTAKVRIREGLQRTIAALRATLR